MSFSQTAAVLGLFPFKNSGIFTNNFFFRNPSRAAQPFFPAETAVRFRWQVDDLIFFFPSVRLRFDLILFPSFSLLFPIETLAHFVRWKEEKWGKKETEIKEKSWLTYQRLFYPIIAKGFRLLIVSSSLINCNSIEISFGPLFTFLEAENTSNVFRRISRISSS